jgi:hypothetical protein
VRAFPALNVRTTHQIPATWSRLLATWRDVLRISLDPKFFGILCPGVARDRDVPKLGTREVVFTGALVRN